MRRWRTAEQCVTQARAENCPRLLVDRYSCDAEILPERADGRLPCLGVCRPPYPADCSFEDWVRMFLQGIEELLEERGS
jgi:hypothetical protein